MRNKLLELKTRCPDPASARVLFQESKQYLDNDNTDSLWRAVSFYIVNKCSFSGLTESSSFSKQASDNNFSFRGIEKLPEYSKLIACLLYTSPSPRDYAASRMPSSA